MKPKLPTTESQFYSVTFSKLVSLSWFVQFSEFSSNVVFEVEEEEFFNYK